MFPALSTVKEVARACPPVSMVAAYRPPLQGSERSPAGACVPVVFLLHTPICGTARVWTVDGDPASGCACFGGMHERLSHHGAASARSIDPGRRRRTRGSFTSMLLTAAHYCALGHKTSTQQAAAWHVAHSSLQQGSRQQRAQPSAGCPPRCARGPLAKAPTCSAHSHSRAYPRQCHYPTRYLAPRRANATLEEERRAPRAPVERLLRRKNWSTMHAGGRR